MVQEWDRLEQLNKEKALIGIYLSEHPLDDYKIQLETYCIELSKLKEIDQLKGKDVKVGGIITDVNHGTTKTGKPFGSITVEDFTDSHKFMMFGKDYVNFKNFFTKGYAILIKGNVQPKFGIPTNELELKISTIDMLSEMKEKMFKSISVKIPIANITKEFIADFVKIIETSKGNADLQFVIYEPESTNWIQMFSRSRRVDISNGLINFLQSNPTVQYKIS